jgi:MFS family permease
MMLAQLRNEVGMLRALRWQSFRRVWLVAFGIGFGYWFSSITFQWLVARDTNNDPLSLSLLYFFMLLPMLLFALPAGILADVRDRRLVMLSAQIAVVGISLVSAVLVVLDAAPFGALLVCGFASGVAQAYAVPSSQALVANSVPVEDLRSAVVIQSAGMNLTRICGPAIAGAIILYIGVVESVLAYGAVALLTILTMRGLRGMTPNQRARPDERLGSRVGSAVRHVRTHPPASTALVLVAATSLFGLSYVAQLPALAARASPDASLFFQLLTLGAVGSGVGVLLVGLRAGAGPNVTQPALMLVVQGAVVVAMAFATTQWLLIALVMLGGAMQFGIMTSCNTVIQAVVHDSFRGRVMSLYVMSWGGLMPIGGLLLGTLWHLFGPEVALGSSGVVALVVAGSVLRPGAVRGVATATPVPEQA